MHQQTTVNMTTDSQLTSSNQILVLSRSSKSRQEDSPNRAVIYWFFFLSLSVWSGCALKILKITSPKVLTWLNYSEVHAGCVITLLIYILLRCTIDLVYVINPTSKHSLPVRAPLCAAGHFPHTLPWAENRQTFRHIILSETIPTRIVCSLYG